MNRSPSGRQRIPNKRWLARIRQNVLSFNSGSKRGQISVADLKPQLTALAARGGVGPRLPQVAGVLYLTTLAGLEASFVSTRPGQQTLRDGSHPMLKVILPDGSSKEFS